VIVRDCVAASYRSASTPLGPLMSLSSGIRHHEQQQQKEALETQARASQWEGEVEASRTPCWA